MPSALPLPLRASNCGQRGSCCAAQAGHGPEAGRRAWGLVAEHPGASVSCRRQTRGCTPVAETSGGAAASLHSLCLCVYVWCCSGARCTLVRWLESRGKELTAARWPAGVPPPHLCVQPRADQGRVAAVVPEQGLGHPGADLTGQPGSCRRRSRAMASPGAATGGRGPCPLLSRGGGLNPTTSTQSC